MRDALASSVLAQLFFFFELLTCWCLISITTPTSPDLSGPASILGVCFPVRRITGDPTWISAFAADVPGKVEWVPEGHIDALSAGEGGAGAWRLVPWTWRQGRTTAMWAARPGGTAAGAAPCFQVGQTFTLTRKPFIRARTRDQEKRAVNSHTNRLKEERF